MARKKKTELADEKWEVISGGNFVEVWHADRCTSENDYAGFEEGAICRMTMPRAHTNTLAQAIACVRPRAQAMAQAPRMLRFIKDLLIELRAYQAEEESNPESPIYWAFEEAKAIINQIERGR